MIIPITTVDARLTRRMILLELLIISCLSMIISGEKSYDIYQHFSTPPPSYDRNYHRGKCLHLWTAPYYTLYENYNE